MSRIDTVLAATGHKSPISRLTQVLHTVKEDSDSQLFLEPH